MPITDILSRLNPAQKQAVTTTEGPVMVIAGPGTGKTEVLSARIAYIIETTGTLAKEILCLTYTDAGAVAMRNRLLEFIGPDAYQANISTFHSFCNTIISEQSDHFGLNGLLAVSELEQNQIVKEIIDSFPLGHPLARSTGDIYYEAKRLLELFSIMKQEGWSPEFLAEKADVWVTSLAKDPDYIYKRAGKAKDGTPYKKGDLNTGKILESTRKSEQFKAAAASLVDYQRLLQKSCRYDFADMILWCNDLFKSNPTVLCEYQERFNYLLVDEFQDTGGAQYELLMQLADYSTEPNIFTVGDDDQSIYRFQGASVENIRRFESEFSSSITKVSLIENHRSSQMILDAAGELIGRNTERLAIDKNLTAVNPEVAGLSYGVELRSYPTVAQETVAAVKEIEALLSCGVPAANIAVIYRNHHQAEDITRHLALTGVPFTARKRVDVLKDPLAEKLLLLLTYLKAELVFPNSGERFIYRLLHLMANTITPTTIAKVAARRVLNKEGSAPAWLEELVGVAGDTSPANLSQEEVEQLKRAGLTLEGLISAAANMTVLDLLSHVITKLNLLAPSPAADQQWNLLVLTTIYEFARDENEKQALTLGRLLSLINEMKEQGIVLPVVKPGNTHGVNLVTAHGSKGLQYDYVFMIGCTAKAWDTPTRSRTYSFPPNIWRSNLGSEEQESRRLFYVAMTRARKRLVITCPERDNNAKDLEKSRFLAELVVGERQLVPCEVEPADLLSFGSAVINELPVERTAKSLFAPELIDSLLENYSLSVTHLSSYLKCPTAFFFDKLLRVPGEQSAAMTFGLAIHYALEHLFKDMLATPGKVFAGSESLVNYFRSYMERRENSFTPAEFRRRMEYGTDILVKYYEKYASGWNKDVIIEVAVKTSLGDVPINGKLDKIEKLTSRALNGDYKTGKFSNAKRKLKGPDAIKTEKALSEGKSPSFEDAHGGDYWRQAVFYRILDLVAMICGKPVGDMVFDFVEPDQVTGEFTQAVVEVTEADIEVVSEQIRQVYKKIRNHEFEQGCDEPDCEWCRFKGQLGLAV